MTRVASEDGSPIRRVMALLAFILGLGVTASAVYTSGFGLLDPQLHRTAAVAVSVVIVVLTASLYFLHKPRSRALASVVILVDVAIVAVTIASLGNLVSIRDAMETGLYDFDTVDKLLGFAGMAVLLELTRRLWGLPLFLFGLITLAYAFFGSHLVWIFYHTGFSFDQIVRSIWYSYHGVFGSPTAIVIGTVWIFIIFGTVLEGTGAGAALLRVSLYVTGRLAGGPAHAAIVASGLFGTMSGSTVANVVGTGTFTIPMIKSRGFSPAFAGGVEAAASTGGQIMPPVMGVAAFLMAELTGIPYLSIAVAALLPALFYYGALFVTVYLEAIRLGIHATPRHERVKLDRSDIVKSLMFIGPIVVIVIVLIMGRSPAMAGFFAVITTLALGILNPEIRRRPQKLVTTLGRAGEACARILVAVGTIGIIIGVMNMTGLGLRFANVIESVGEGSLALSLILSMAGCLVLGMGMPTLPAYLIIVLVMGRALEILGLPVLVTHMFVFYFGVLSAITPPVALAAYAAAPIANANPLTTAMVALKLALPGFVLPFIFAFQPELLLVLGWEPFHLGWLLIRMCLAVWLFATGIIGMRLPLWQRTARLAASAAVVWESPAVHIAGIALAVAVIAYNRYLSRRLAAADGGSA